MDNLSQTDVVLLKCCFILHNFGRDAWRNLWLFGNTGTSTVNKMALPIEVSAEMVSYSYFYWKKYDCNWVTKLCSNMLLQYVRHTAQTDKVSLVFWSTVSPNLRPHGATRTMWVYFTLCQQSTLKSQNSGCVLYWKFWPHWWPEKIKAGNSQKLGCCLY